MFRDDEFRNLQPRLGKLHPAVPCFQHVKAPTLVPVMMRQHGLRRRSLPEIVHEGRKPDDDILRSLCDRIYRRHRMRKRVPFRVERHRLRFPDQRKEFGKYRIQ